MTPKPNIFLVGPMGAGKTTVGRQLARGLRMEFVDSDRVLEERTGARIPLIFDVEGEEGFRVREAAVIAELTSRQGIVLATGGGAVLREENRAVLRERGFVVYVCADVDVLFERTARDRNRPLLQTDDPRGTLAQLMKVREPLYRAVAHMTVDTGKGSVKELVRTVIGRLAKEGLVERRSAPPRAKRAAGKAGNT